MKFAFFTHWELSKPGIKVKKDEERTYRPDGMLPLILNADVYNFTIPLRTEVIEKYDWIIINNDKAFYKNKALVEQIFSLKKPKIAVLQEGPIFDWQTWKMEQQWIYRKLLKKAELFICNNKEHIKYYKEYCKNVCTYRAPINLEKFINHRLKEKEDAIMINGNNTPWYNANSSMDIAKSIRGFLVCMQSMGQSQTDEVQYLPLLLPDNNFMKIPFVAWNQWMDILSDFKYAINMMTAVASGTFSVNCAAVGTLCIGNKQFDTQSYLFPNLSIDAWDIKKGKELLKRLVEDKEFRDEQIKIMRERVKEYDVDMIKKEMLENFKKVI